MTFIVEIVIKIRTAATTIDGPEGVSKNNDENIPKITATTPKKAEKTPFSQESLKVVLQLLLVLLTSK